MQCACLDLGTNVSFAIESENYIITYETETITEDPGLSLDALFDAPTTMLTVASTLLVLFIGFWWLFSSKKKYIPLLALPDIVFRDIRDKMFNDTSYGHILFFLFSPQYTNCTKCLQSCSITCFDYHLLCGICCASPHSNLSPMLRWVILFV